MRLNKKVIESFVVLCSLCVMVVTAVISGGQTNTKAKSADLKMNGVAGVTTVLSEYELAAAEELNNVVCVENTNIDVVTASAEDAEPVVEEPVLTEEEQAWQNNLMANVSESLNVRAEANGDSEIVGKLYQGDLATIVEPGAEWTKITSGNVNGYVCNEYCVMGTDALNYAKANCDTVAKSLTEGLRVRSEQNTEASVLTTLEEGETIKVDTEAEAAEGWVAVKYDSQTCYVSSEFVEVSIKTGTGITVEEEAAAIAAEAERKAEEARKEAEREAARAAAQRTESVETTQGSAVEADVDEATLLAAIIYCEAGGESYETQLAVGAVVVNRMKSGSYPSSVSGVVYQSGQFSPVRSGKLDRVLANGNYTGCTAAAQAALSGQDNTGGALHFRMATSGYSGLIIGSEVFY